MTRSRGARGHIAVVTLATLALAGGPHVPVRADATCGATPSAAVSAGPFGIEHCETLQPGVAIEVGDRGRPRVRCSAGFVVVGADGTRYMSTAGRCLSGGRYYRATAFGDSGPLVYRKGEVVGRAVYGVYAGHWRDFALFHIAPGVVVDPAVAYWGGPTRLYTDRTDTPVLLRHFGVGSGIKEVFPARSAVAFDTLDARRVLVSGVFTDGDQGSPVMTADGRAVALASRATARPSGTTFERGTFWAIRVDLALREAEAVLGATQPTKLEVATGPLR